MSKPGTFEHTARAISQHLGQSVARILENDRVLFRAVDTGRFSFSTNIWGYFREHYEELRFAGAFE